MMPETMKKTKTSAKTKLYEINASTALKKELFPFRDLKVWLSPQKIFMYPMKSCEKFEKIPQ